MKTCTKCYDAKPLDRFWRDTRRPGGRQASCIECRSRQNRDRRAANPEKVRAADFARYWANPTKERERHLIRKYGVTIADYERMLAEQGGTCAICGAPPGSKKRGLALDVDHDHETGAVRGLLCTSCNRMLGHAGDSAERLIAGVRYLLSSRKLRPSSSKRT